jgi:hypothetical protein
MKYTMSLSYYAYAASNIFQTQCDVRVILLFQVNDLPSDYDYGGSISYCGTVSGQKYPDSKPMGFPFDRQIDSDCFFSSNIYQKDVIITFKDSE